MRNLVRLALVGACSALLPLAAAAQVPAPRPIAPLGPADAGPFSGAVPAGEKSAQPLALTLADAIGRGLEHNLGVITRQESVETARGDQWRARSAVLPDISGRLGADREVINLAALGFTGFPGIPSVIGPFNVFDARVAISQPIVDPEGWQRLRGAGHDLEAARHNYRNARDLVVVAVTNLYLQALATESRVAVVRAQLDTADALAAQAEDRRKSGLVPAIDSLRAEVQRQTERQRLVMAQNVAAKQKLALSRAVGLPLGQEVTLTDAMPNPQSAVPSLDEAVKEAYAHREDLQGQQEALDAARAISRAASAAHLPTLHFDANWGAIGDRPSTAIPTYTIAANVRVPLFGAGSEKAQSVEAAATLRRRNAELEETRARVYYEVQTALLDVESAQQQVDLASRAVELADQQLVQARDRFGAGVADTIEVVQAQEAVATAHDTSVASLYGYNAAKASLAAALGLAEEQMPRFLGATK
jgi:outer membrane protein TolC